MFKHLPDATLKQAPAQEVYKVYKDPEDDESPADRMVDHIITIYIMKHLKLPQQWISAEPHMLSDAIICSPLQSAMLLKIMCNGLESLNLITPQERYLTVGGAPVQTNKDAGDIRMAFARAIQCPRIPSSSPIPVQKSNHEH